MIIYHLTVAKPCAFFLYAGALQWIFLVYLHD